LWEADRARVPVEPLTDRHRGLDVSDGYAIQTRNIERRVAAGRLTPVTDIDPRLVGMALSRNGEVIDTGAGAAALGNPVRCVAWLANKLGSFGITLQAGDVVLPGAVHGMVAVRPGDVFRAEYAHLGAVTARFSNGAATRAEVQR